MIDAVTIYLFGLKYVVSFTAILIALNGLDDLIIDLLYWGRRVFRGSLVYTRYQRADAATLPDRQETWFAIMVPAWDEAAVIGHMLAEAINRIDYDRYVIFVGCYPNDPGTREAAEAINSLLPGSALPESRGSRIVCVDVGHDGPTTKADCLNAIYAAAQKWQTINQTSFSGYVLHDAEDVVHQLELRVFNFLIDRKDMIQLPVVPLRRGLGQFVGGHYLDEFAEAHSKDLVVREMLCRGLPSAGVGCAFSARAMRIAAQRTGVPFNQASVTEDYEFALRLQAEGCVAAFVRIPQSDGTSNAVATREYFPSRFRDAVRQKSRWLMGIALQGWQSLGWRGTLLQKYMLFRDRKALFISFLNILAYILVLHFLILIILPLIWADSPRFLSLVDRESLTWWLLIANAVFFANRLVHRVYFTFRLYGTRQSIMSIPRQIVGNVINFCAGLRALWLFAKALHQSTRIRWDKTDHAFPVRGRDGQLEDV
ncbi:MAG: glycosyl transferase family protein [Pseudomonadota bacterium]